MTREPARDERAAGPGPAILVISGSMGSGKTTVMAEASDLLTARGVVHAAIDLDALGIARLPDRSEGLADDLTYRNLTAVWQNFLAAGVARLLIAAAIESRVQLDRVKAAVCAADLVVCRLTAGVGTMEQRVRVREPGMLQGELVARVAALEAILDAAGVEDFALSNDGRDVTDVAQEL